VDGNNIIADNLELKATGDIGGPGRRLIVATGSITSESRNLYLKNNSPYLVVKGITAKETADIIVGGKMVCGVLNAKDINLLAFGDIGVSDDDPFVVYVPGSVKARSKYGDVYLRNDYREPPEPPEPPD